MCESPGDRSFLLADKRARRNTRLHGFRPVAERLAIKVIPKLGFALLRCDACAAGLPRVQTGAYRLADVEMRVVEYQQLLFGGFADDAKGQRSR